MKKVIFTLSLFCIIAVANAQYCGGSGPSVCQPQILTKPGLSPVSDSLAPVIDDVPTTTIIEFQNYDTLTFGGQVLTMDSLTIDTISNIPSGLCWATSSATNTFGNQQNGCIKVTGTTHAAAGQYKLHIIVKAYTTLPFPVTTNADAAGLYYYVRLNCSDSAKVQPVDTNGEANGTIASFKPYASQAVCDVSVKNIESTVQSLNVFPNPMSSHAEVSFTSAKAGVMTEKITSIIGSVVYSKEIEVVTGQNAHAIERNNLSAGVYFYTITDGVSTFTKRVVISE